MIITTQALLLICFAIRPSVTDDSVDLSSNDTINYYKNYTTLKFDDCGGEKCIRKCCQNGFSYHHEGNSDDGQLIGECRKNDDSINFSIPIYEGDKKVQDLFDGFKTGIINCTNLVATKWYPECSEPTIYLQRNGTFYFTAYKQIANIGEYCVDAKDGIPTYYYCSSQNLERVHTFIRTVEIIPIPFLLLTCLVYAILPEWNIHRKALMAHTLCLVIGYVLLVGTNLYEIKNNTICLIAGYVTTYCFFTAEFWMNVMWIDIWLTFGGMQGLQKRLSKYGLFIAFCIYAFGLNGLCLLTFSLYRTITGTGKYCPFETGNACYQRAYSFLYNFINIAILSVVNIVLFILTTLNMRRIKKESDILKLVASRITTSKNDKYTIYWSLLCLLGFNPLSLLHEIISKAGWLDSDVYVTFTSIITGVYGPMVFVLFVCRKSIWKELQERYHQFTGKSEPNASVSTLLSRSSSERMLSETIIKSPKEKFIQK